MRLLLGMFCALVSVQACEGDVEEVLPKPDSPKLRAPFNGENTGSAHVDSNLRPRFVWESVENTQFYELDLTTDCKPFEGNFEPTQCNFVSQIVQTSVETKFELTENLPVSRVAPVGSRYFWRVRSCVQADQCSDWSRIRYLNVGRQAQDINGDGYADLVIGGENMVESENLGSNIYVFLGSPKGTSTIPDFIFESDFDDSYSITLPGDINADGFSDLVISSRNEQDVSSQILLGKDKGLEVSKSVSGIFMTSSAGDFDGDGFVDLLGGNGISSKIFYGTKSHVFSNSSITTFDVKFRDTRSLSMELGGSNPTSIGDINGDGYPDIGISYGRSDDISKHKLGVLYGGVKCTPFGSDEICKLEKPKGTKLDTSVPFKESMCGTDINGDGFSDLVVGVPSDELPGDVYVFSGSATFEGKNLIKIPNPKTRKAAHFGISVDCGDVNGDGFGDFIIGAPFQLPDYIGAAYMFYGSKEELTATPHKALEHPDPQGGFTEFGGNVANIGDINGDGFDEFGVTEFGWEQLGKVYILMGDAEMPNSEIREIGDMVENRNRFGEVVGK